MLKHSVFNPVSPQALAISNLFIFIMIISLVILLIIVGILAYTTTHFRYRPGQEDPPQRFGLTRLEITWTVIPFLLLLIVFGATLKTISISAPPNDNAVDGHHPDLTIVAHQWWWEVRYTSGVVTANEIHIPVGQRMMVALRSADVIHSLWVPQINGKTDSVPGQTNFVYMEADRAGSYESACVEYCGDGHSRMRALVIAQPPAQYQAWVRQQLATPPAPTGLAAEGAKLYQQFGCQSCHAASIGPDLTHFGSRGTLGAVTLTNTPAHLEEWLRDPQSVKPGVNMPNFQLSKGETQMLAAYLEGLK
jgi:cytochrome c oxidase subunit 2